MKKSISRSPAPVPSPGFVHHFLLFASPERNPIRGWDYFWVLRVTSDPDHRTLWTAHVGPWHPWVWSSTMAEVSALPNLFEHHKKNQKMLLDSGFPKPSASESLENLFKMQILGSQSNLLDPKFWERSQVICVLTRLSGDFQEHSSLRTIGLEILAPYKITRTLRECLAWGKENAHSEEWPCSWWLRTGWCRKDKLTQPTP